ncbi:MULTISPECIES: hypothetical protein [unclassified Acinetobacter]|uniref:hypothetical protein n=1 Tax=unclassified Acinetobacter TaxID=196816 RepID=UPI0035BB3121
MMAPCHDLQTLYQLYDNCLHNEHLRPYELSDPVWHAVGYETLTMLHLAYLTKQPDYPQRVEQYRQEYLQQAKRWIEGSKRMEKRWQENGQSYTPSAPFEQQFQVYREMFEELVAFIASLDVDAILSAPPVRREFESGEYS